MPEQYDHPIKNTVEAAAQLLVTRTVPEIGEILNIGGEEIPDVDIYDFASYVFLRKPQLSLTENFGDYSAGLEMFLDEIYRIIVQTVNQEVIKDKVVSDGEEENERAAEGAIISQTVLQNEIVQYTFTYTDAYREMIVEECYDLFLTHLAVELYELVVRVFIEHEPRVYEIFRIWLESWIGRYEDIQTDFLIGEIISIWEGSYLSILNLLEQKYPDTSYLTYIDNSIKYSFVPFREDEINFGLRLVYRQEWQKLGNQKGRVIKTIPLGPKQVEKVTIKSVSTQKVSQQVETVETAEQTRETEVSESNSNDVVSDTASSFNWNVDTNASYSMGTGSVSLSAGIGGDQSSSSQNTKKTLSDSADKSATKQRKETKLIISTERSSTDELTRTSEIQNPNEEVAITYVYSEMYQKFKVYTSLAEIQSVVFVPENIPHPMQINEEFVKRFDWILRSSLLDQSFEEDLDRIVKDIDEDNVLAEGAVDPFLSSFEQSTVSMEEYKGYQGTMPDFFKSTGENYMKQADKQRVIDNRKKLRQLRNDRLFQHIRDNILHYMRSIWSQEDPEQRMQRYRNIEVPTQWEFVPNEGSAMEGMTGAWDGEFIPVPESSRALVEIVNPAGPIGWAANYAIFYLKIDPSTLNLNKALSKLRSYYVRYAITVEADENRKFRTVSLLEPHWNEAIYNIKYHNNQLGITVNTPFVEYTIDESKLLLSQDRKQIEFEGIYVLLEQALDNNHEYTVKIVATGLLQDPEESVKKVLYPLPEQSDEAIVFDPIMEEMVEFFPELREYISGDTWGTLLEEERQLIRDRYHQFLMMRENTRKVLLKSRNPMIDLLIGDTPALEQFKRLHRAVDVVKALEEYSGERYESIRKRLRIQEGIYSDPDIDNVTIVGDGTDLRSLVGATIAAATESKTVPTSTGSDDFNTENQTD